MTVPFFNQILRALHGSSAHPQHDVPVYTCEDWRQPLLVEAARKHGKPFKCAGDELPREVILGGKDLVVVDFEPNDMSGTPRSIRLVGQSKFQEAALARLGGTTLLRHAGSSE